MKNIIFTIFMLLSFHGVADAKRLSEKKILSGSQEISEENAYIYVSGNIRQSGVFFKQPNEDDIKEYNLERDKKFAKAEKKYTRELDTWRRRREAKLSAGPKPKKPNLETFDIGAIDLRHVINFGLKGAYRKDKTDKDNPHYSYLMQVEPGIYTYAGPLVLTDKGYSGHCYCMGSVKFEAKAGEITNIGDFLLRSIQIENGGIESIEMLERVDKLHGADFVGHMALGSNEKIKSLDLKPSYAMPESLKVFKHVQANFRAANKRDNHFLAIISRMGPIEGILAYDGDRVIDLKAKPLVTVGFKEQEATIEGRGETATEIPIEAGTEADNTLSKEIVQPSSLELEQESGN